MIKTLDRYILKEFAKIFSLTLVFLVGMYLIVDFFERARMFLSNHATIYHILCYFFLNIPMILSQMIPVAFLLGTLLTFGILSKNSEITAMKANGISLRRVALPVIILSAGICLLTFGINEFVTPYTNQKAKYIKLVKIQKRKEMGAFKQDQIWYKGKKGIYNFSVFDPKSGRLEGIRINYLDPKMNLTMRIDAKDGEWKDGKWIFHDLLITTFPKDSFPVIRKAKSEIIDIPEKPSDFMTVQKDAEDMGLLELARFTKKIKSEGYDATQYIADLHGKIAFPLVIVVLAVLGPSFSMKSERSGGLAQGMGAGIVIGFSYWIVFAFAVSLGRSGTIPPVLAAWTANILLGTAALVMFFRIKT